MLNTLVKASFETKEYIVNNFPNSYQTIKYEDVLSNPSSEVDKIIS